jgi:uncharacterized protein (TIGR03118 family)
VTSDPSIVSINPSDLLKDTPSFIGGVLNDVSQDFRNFVRSHETTFTQTNLVSDGLVPAAHIDPNLINPWGVAYSSASPFWVSDNGTGVSTLYDGTGIPQPLVVTIATPPGQNPGTAAPTGQVFNTNTEPNSFAVTEGSNTATSRFIFATEDGTISGWNPAVDPTNSILAVDNSTNPDAGADGQGAVYKGLTIGDDNGQTLLYAANFRHGTVDVFDDKFNQVNSFTDPSLPGGYAPFNVQVLDGKLFVTYAQQDAAKHDDVAGAHQGFVDEFDLTGNLLTRVASGGPLDSPWGLAIAPSSFGAFAGDLLVGNFGDGTINAFDPKTDAFMGKMLGPDGKPIVIGDLWELIPGNGAGAGDQSAIYFTAGVSQEKHGLFGSLTPNMDAGPLASSMPDSHPLFG